MNAVLLSVLGPLAAAALILLLRRAAGPLAVAGAAVGLLGAAVALRTGPGFAVTLPGLPGLPLRLVGDRLALVLSATVAAVSLVVLIYALGYMAGDLDRPRFFAAMSFFVAAMQTLVLAGDWILLLAAWEAIGFASWLLIGFWFDRPGVGAAATRAFATTRAADVGLYLGVFALVGAAGTSEIAATLVPDPRVATIAGLGLLVAAMGKSAQAPLQGWLQDAMAGPTPVSALLHSATLVVAGVVLLARADPLLVPEVRLAVGLVGGVTAIVAGLTAVAQPDLKRLLAASTSSQLGLMLLAIGSGSPVAAVVHLVANAAMKSTLFLGAGVFQHERESTAFADLAGVGRERRGVFAALAIAGFALAGVPPLAGFWSKDAIIAAALHAPLVGLFVPLALAGSALTGIYVARMLRLLWDGEPRPEARPPGAPGDRAMDAALAAGIAAILVFGAFLPALGSALGAEVPEAPLAIGLGLAAAALGLGVGARASADGLLGPLAGPARSGFRLDGGLDGLVARPALALGEALARLDRAIHGGVLAAGGRVLATAAVGRRADDRLHAGVLAVGRWSLDVAAATRFADERGIDRAIAGIVAGTRALGVAARRLQSGLVHRELLLAAAGAAVVLAVILLS